MIEFLRTPTAQVVVWSAGLFVLLVVAYYVVRTFRDRIDGDQPTASDWLTNFREMHDEGDITDEEFRTIKTVLGEKLHSELKDAEQKG